MNGNELIRSLPARSRARLMEQGEIVAMKARQILADRRVVERNVFFPEEGLIATQVKVEERTFAGVGVVGKAGVAGMGGLIGTETSIFRLAALCHGRVFKISTEALSRLIRQDQDLELVLYRSMRCQLAVAAQIGACNAFHSAPQRLSRWLLTAAYMSSSNEVCLSQKTVGALLGLRRPTVTTCLSRLREAGLIEVGRERLIIRDLAVLEAGSCRCHKTIRREIRHQSAGLAEPGMRKPFSVEPGPLGLQAL